MMINVSAGTECRIAILHDNRLEEFFIERDSTQSHVGNIYKGRITNVEPSIQAAFVDFGLEKNGFLHISDVQPQYFPNHTGEPEDVGRKIPRHLRPPIQRCFRRGQEVIVQITKEGVGTKGPTLTSYLSIPGRFLVMMPGMSRHGVSRKIEDEVHRREMRDLMAKLDLPTGMGFILRTAGLGRNQRELQRDLNYLVRLWKTVVERIKRMATPAELYRESDLVTRTIRDIYNADFDRIVIDDATVAKKVGEFLQIAVPRSKTVVEHYADREPLFHRFGIEAELERINMRHVPLRSGGSLVIDSTEAMVAIDVNSGRFRTPADAEETALQINIEAAEEIARQLRLRDLGGLIVCDFIDMRHDRNKRKVENALRDALKNHKERARILRMSAFGLIEMTRQRQGPSLHRNLYTDCPECHGTGHVKLPESVTLDAMRMIQFAAHQEQVQRIVLSLSSEVAFRLLNQKRGFISQVESETNKSIVIHGNGAFTSDQMEIACEDARGRSVTISATAPVQNNGRLANKG
jgi:ribonuclease E